MSFGECALNEWVYQNGLAFLLLDKHNRTSRNFLKRFYLMSFMTAFYHIVVSAVLVFVSGHWTTKLPMMMMMMITNKWPNGLCCWQHSLFRPGGGICPVKKTVVYRQRLSEEEEAEGADRPERQSEVAAKMRMIRWHQASHDLWEGSAWKPQDTADHRRTLLKTAGLS